MKILIVTQNAPVYLAPFLDDLLTRLKGAGHTVSGVVALSPVFKKSLMAEVKERFAYYGPIDFLRMTAFIVRTKLLSKLTKIFPACGCHSLDNVLKKHQIQRRGADDVNSPNFVTSIQAERIDLIISVASPKIFKSELLRAPARGCINYHTGMLPRFRGRQPLFWALRHGEAEVGVTVHEMDEQLDNGPILAQRSVPIEPRDTLHSLYLKTIHIGPQVLTDAVEKVAEGGAERIKNDSARATYFGFPQPADVRAFRKAGRRFF
jgi:methionyl-tRNA formyltransferase